jgi:hypothetical protein
MLGSINRALGAKGFYPIPSFVYSLLNRMAPHRAMLTYARLMDGVDLSYLVPDDVGCAESVTRICNMLFGDDIITGTYTLLHHYEKYPHLWKEIPFPVDGCVALAATGTGNGSIPGHVIIYDKGRGWSNNSMSGRWDKHFSITSFKERYQVKGGMRVRYFIRIRVKK